MVSVVQYAPAHMQRARSVPPLLEYAQGCLRLRVLQQMATVQEILNQILPLPAEEWQRLDELLALPAPPASFACDDLEPPATALTDLDVDGEDALRPCIQVMPACSGARRDCAG